MEMTQAQIDRLCRLARLQLKPEERSAVARQLEDIVGYLDALKGLEVSDTPPLYHPLPLKNVLRPDRCTSSLPRAALLDQAPVQDGNTILVPRTVE